MSHLYIFPTMHHIPMEPHRSIFIMYQWQFIDPSSSYQWKLIDQSSSMHSHQGQYILHYINHQSINPLASINHLISINDINQSNHWHQWQHDPTISPFGIDGNTHALTLILHLWPILLWCFSPHVPPPLWNQWQRVSPLGVAPLVYMLLIFLFLPLWNHG